MNVRLEKKNYIAEQSVNLFIAGMLLLPIYIDLMGTLAVALGFSTKATTYLYYFSMWGLLAASLPKILKGISQGVLVGAVLFLILVILQYLLFPDNVRFVRMLPIPSLITFSSSTLLTVVPFILVGLAVTDIRELFRLLHAGARIGVVLGAISYLLAVWSGQDIHYDDMSTAYAICPVVCILIACYRKRDFYFVGMGLFSLMMAGTRGPLVCVLVAAILKVVVLTPNSPKKQLKLILGVLAYIVLQTDLLMYVLDLMEAFFGLLGIEDLRIINYFREGMMLDSSGRDTYFTMVAERMLEKPFLGFGVGGDRIITQRSYVHNIILELWASYGIFIGTAILGWMGYWIVQGIRARNTEIQEVTTALFCGIVVKLFLSSSYLLSKELFVFLGICIACARIPKEIELQGGIKIGTDEESTQNNLDADQIEE